MVQAFSKQVRNQNQFLPRVSSCGLILQAQPEFHGEPQQLETLATSLNRSTQSVYEVLPYHTQIGTLLTPQTHLQIFRTNSSTEKIAQMEICTTTQVFPPWCLLQTLDVVLLHTIL